MALKHTELTDKEVDGIIDHADVSITADKLAYNINAAPKGFNAFSIGGLRLRRQGTYKIKQLGVGDEYHVNLGWATYPRLYFATYRYYDPDYIANYHRLQLLHGSVATGIRVIAIKNLGPDIAYGIHVDVWEIEVL